MLWVEGVACSEPIRSSPRKRGPRGQALDVLKSGSPLPRGRTEIGEPHATTNRFHVVALSQKKIGPCLRLWARGRPHSSSSVSLGVEGDGAPQGAWPGFRQTGPRVRGSL